MKDARLVADYQYAKQRESHIADGRAASLAPWFEQVVAAIVNSPLLINFKSKMESCTGTENIVEQIKKADRSELPGQAVAIIEGLPSGFIEEIDAVSNGDYEASNQAAWVWGVALARICIGANSNGKLLETCYLIARDEVSSEAFLDEISSVLAQEDYEYIYSALNDLVTYIAEQPEKYAAARDREQYRQVVLDWKVETNLSEVWSFRAFEYFPYYCEPIGVLEAVRRSDPDRYLQLLEVIALPPVIEGAFSRLDISYDFDVILQLLSIAPPTFESDGDSQVWNRKLTAPILLERGLEHVRNVANVICRSHDEELDNAESIRDREVLSLLHRFTEVLLGRQDGTFLAVHWMCYLIGMNGPKPWGNPVRWTPIPTAIEAMASGLYAKRIKLEDIINLLPQYSLPNDNDLKKFRQSGVGDLNRYAKPSGLDILLAYLWIANQTESKSSYEDETSLSFFESLLVRQDGGLFITLPEACPTDREYYPALLYATQNQPVDAWTKSWTLLAEQRRLFRHRWADTSVPRSEDPSFFLANVGLAAVDWLISPEIAKSEQALPLCRAIFDAVFNVVITPPSFNKERWHNLIAKLFCRLPHVSDRSDRSSLVVEYLIRLGGDDKLFIWSLANACQNGANISDVTQKIEHLGAYLKERLEAYVDWEGRESNRRRNDKMIETCKKLLQDLQKE